MYRWNGKINSGDVFQNVPSIVINPESTDATNEFYNLNSTFKEQKEPSLNELQIKIDAIRIQLELLEETYFQKINEIEKKLNGFKEILLRVERKIDKTDI